MLRGVVTAVRTLTIIPVPGKECGTMSGSLYFFPLVGFFISLAIYGLAAALHSFFFDYAMMDGFLIALFITVLTGALHLDGFADVADGLLGGSSREKCLEIMKDPRHGTFGVTAIVVAVIARVNAYSLFISHWYPWYFWCGPFLSRTVMAFICSTFPYAREEGKARGYVGKNRSVMFVMLGIGILSLFLSACCAPFCGVLAFLITLAAAGAATGYCLSRLGGITGDCLGAVNEITEIVFLYCSIGLIHVFQF